MRALVLALLLAAPCYAETAREKDPWHGVPPTQWAIYAETSFNSSDNVEALLGASVERWYIEARARDAEFTSSMWHCRSRTCTLGIDERLEYEVRTGWQFGAGNRVIHGPVLNYTSRATGENTWAGGWRFEIRSKE